MEHNAEAETIEIGLFLEAIEARYGYDLRGYAAPSIHRRVLSALAKSGLGHLGELQHMVLHDAGFFARVLEDLTVRVSDMFRDPKFYRTFRERVVPVLRTYPLLHIWHAGCASGEEVYTTAIVLTEEGLYDRSQIYATDMSAVALDQARQGIYAAAREPAFAESYGKASGSSRLSAYYTKAYDRIAMKESLRRHVLFFEHNLVSDQVFGEMQLIVCRNVLIYFGAELKDQVLHRFAESLRPGGFLCLGSSERLSGRHPFAEFAVQERIYRYMG